MAHILIIDDDMDIIEASKVVLELDGHEVAYANSYDEGLKAALDGNPDLLILDVMMDEPDDGFKLAQDLRRRDFRTPIIMLTSVSLVTGFEFGKDPDLLPVDDFLQKPVDPGLLQQKVNEYLPK